MRISWIGISTSSGNKPHNKIRYEHEFYIVLYAPRASV